MKKITSDSIICLSVIYLLSLFITHPSDIISFIVIAIVLFCLLIIISQVKQNNNENYINIVNIKNLYLAYLCEMACFVLIILMYKIIKDLFNISQGLWLINLLCFYYLSKNIFFRSIGYKMLNISYDLTIPNFQYKVLINNIIYFSILLLGIYNNQYNILLNSNITNIISFLLLLFVCDWGYWLFIGKDHGIIHKILRIRVKQLNKIIL